MKGVFISAEGPDGAGKTTNIKILEQWFKSQGREVILTREPGGTVVGEKIREVLLNNSMASMTEILMFAAARIEHLEKLIIPSLAEGKIVICDRFSDSTYAYQASGRGLYKEVETMEHIVHPDFEPHHTLFFDITLEESLRRLHVRTGGELDVFEKEANSFRERVYNGYKTRFQQKLHRMVRIDAMQAPAQVSEQVIKWANDNFSN